MKISCRFRIKSEKFAKFSACTLQELESSLKILFVQKWQQFV